MEYTTLGSSGMTVSRICFGRGRFGRGDEAKLDEEAVEAVDLSLSASDLEYLEEPYDPKPVSGPS